MSLYRYHCENLRQVEDGFDSVIRILRKSISQNLENEVISFTRILTYLLSCWTEVRLYKIIEETHNSSFTESQKAKIFKKDDSINSLEDKWKNTINISICRTFNFTESIDRSIIETYLDNDPINKQRYINIMDCLDNELRDTISLRNKIAHGQWVHALNRKNDAINRPATNKIDEMNIVTIQLKQKMYKSLANIIHDLVVSLPTFERDFNKNYDSLIANRDNFHKRDYEDYRLRMRKKYLRGLEKRNYN